MKAKEFIHFRKKLNKTQRQMSQLLGISIKAVHSYEQGWRSIPSHVERQLLFLMSCKARGRNKKTVCWEEKNCPDKRKMTCPAWEFNAGSFCWSMNGTICDGQQPSSWEEKMKRCKSCRVYQNMIKAMENE